MNNPIKIPKKRMENPYNNKIENKMERSLQTRYLNSQDQLIISLNEQIESMAPLKDSYASLQRYHIKLLNDFQTLLGDHDQNSVVYAAKIQDLLALNQELDAKKNHYIDELRALENQKAKLTLERKNMMSCCETLSNKFNLENEQNVMLQQRTRQIIENIKKTQQNITMYRRIISQIQSDIRLKSAESTQTENEILRRVQFNRKLTQRIESTESQIKTVTTNNEKTMNDLRTLDKTQDAIESRIREELRKIKELNEKILSRRDQLAQLGHQKQYYTRLIESQLVIKDDLDISESKLNGLLERRLKECDKIAKENSQIQNKIKCQEENYEKSDKYKQTLTMHLSELAKANAILLETMKKTCKEDEKVHLILHKKLDNLDSAMIRSSDTETSQVYKKNLILRQRTNELSTSKKAQKSGSTWINQLDMQNL